MPTSAINNEKSSLVLLRAYQFGDDAAFSELYSMYVQTMLNYGRCITSDVELIKDCIQDVFVKMLDRRDSLKITSVSSYLIVSLKNSLLDEFRKASYNNVIELDRAKNMHMSDDVEKAYLDAESERLGHAKIVYLLNTLTPRQRAAFQLYYLDERKYDEIRDIMNMNYHSVRNFVHRGMIKLRTAAV